MPQAEHAFEQPAALPEDAASAEIRTLKAENRTLKERVSNYQDQHIALIGSNKQLRERNKMLGKMVLELHDKYNNLLQQSVAAQDTLAAIFPQTTPSLGLRRHAAGRALPTILCTMQDSHPAAAPEQARCEEASTASGAPIQLEQNATHEAHMAAGAAAPACRGKMASLVADAASSTGRGKPATGDTHLLASPPNPVLGHDSTYATARTTTGSLPRSSPRADLATPAHERSSSTSGDCAAVPSPERVLASTTGDEYHLVHVRVTPPPEAAADGR